MRDTTALSRIGGGRFFLACGFRLVALPVQRRAGAKGIWLERLQAKNLAAFSTRWGKAARFADTANAPDIHESMGPPSGPALSFPDRPIAASGMAPISSAVHDKRSAMRIA
ncbi:hypothetical protein [Lysobacter sp. Root690]|uniref:hypothetical protein n=1 Tax=Lysobacter sp. Root690 TaxID=1736588 RepID=UPI0006F613EE|nr:hypothetical protein [Lysobacter sp. Root690]KRB10258.1 hypothetical protein ASD86_24995 [Lysobacter sp. Root690]